MPHSPLMNTAPDAPPGGPISSKGFSLIEILLVVAVVGLLAAFSGPLLRSVGAASDLATAGALVTASFDHARKNALTHNKPTAVAIVIGTEAESDAVDRAYALFELDADSGTWGQVERWHLLPPGIAFDESIPPENRVGFFQPAKRVITPALSDAAALRLHGKTVTVAAQVFLPSGQIYGQTSPVLCRLIDTHSATAGKTDYYQVVLNEDTGRIKIERP